MSGGYASFDPKPFELTDEQLAEIASQVPAYTHPATHPATMITEDVSHRFTTDTEKGTWNGKQNALGFTPAVDNHVHTGVYEAANTNIQTHVTSSHAPADAEANVNADWNAVSGDAQILNKPTIPAAQIQSDWTQASTGALDFIKNKPAIPVVSDVAYDASSWDNNTDAPSKNAVRDKFESLSTGSVPISWGKYF
jgi:hypothetical protein